MKGAESLIRTLVEHGVEVCFMNPGTSEMHFVAALDQVTEMHGILATFEGVATGAADGYARMAGRPAATLLHLGPGLGNGLANLHNARRARSPVVNIVGDHALSHQKYDAPLQSDIATVARNVSTFVRSSDSASSVGADAVDTVAAAVGPPGAVATLILPADVSWSEGGKVEYPASSAGGGTTCSGRPPEDRVVEEVAAALRSDEPSAVLIDGRACVGEALDQAADIAARTGAKLLAETFPARLERGAGRPAVDRLAYLAEFVAMQLDGLRHLVLVDSRRPVSFFAYPDKPSDLVPDACAVHTLAGPLDDVTGALSALASLVGTDGAPAPRQVRESHSLPTGPLTAQAVCEVLGVLLPEGAIVSDEGNSAGLWASGATAGSPPHDWLCLTGGAIGQGLPVATGAAMAAPGRRVVALEADGSALYTLQSWWTMARQGLDVTSIVLNNHSYAVLNMELGRVGASAGPRARDMLDLRRPDIDFVDLATGLGVPATRAEDAEAFADQLGRALSTPGPSVVEAVLPASL